VVQRASLVPGGERRLQPQTCSQTWAVILGQQLQKKNREFAPQPGATPARYNIFPPGDNGLTTACIIAMARWAIAQSGTWTNRDVAIAGAFERFKGQHVG